MSHPQTPTSWRHLAGTGTGLALVLTVLALAFLWPALTSEPRDLPVAVAGPAAAVESLAQGLDARAPGAFEVVAADDRDAAVDLVETREAYGAVVLGPEPEILTATAASPLVAQQLAALAPVLSEQVAQATGDEVRVPVTDIVPLGSGDPRGAVLGALTFPLVIGGLIGGIAITLTVVGVARRVVAVVGYSVVGGLAVAAVVQGWFGALYGSYLVNAGIVALGILATAGVVVGFAAVVGRRGIAIGPVLFLLVANPIASAAQPWQMLPAPWGAIGQWLPPGAAAALLRDESYFPLAPTAGLWTALVGWAALGLLLAAAGHLRGRRQAAPGATEQVPVLAVA